MKKNLTELVIIIDKSGSMDGLVDDVVGGYNSLIKEQKELVGEVLVTTILFDTKVDYLNKRVGIEGIKEMTDADYCPFGCTALLDAIGKGISYIKKTHEKLAEENKPENVIFSIMTDGLENSSTQFTYKKIHNLIEKQKEEGWSFLFQAANIDELEEGERIGFSREDINAFEATSEGVKYCMKLCSAEIYNKRAKSKKEK